jgi:formylglycine-generating enzyme required for sulfatase activity
MKRIMRNVVALVAGLSLSGWVATAAMNEGVEIFSAEVDRGGATPEIKLRWETDPTRYYRLLTRPSLSEGDWELAAGAIPAPALTYEASVPTTNQAAFFRVERLDREPPAYRFVSPRKDAVAVPTNAVITVSIADASPIDPSSVVFSINETDYTVSMPELIFSDGLLTYSNAAGLGPQGATVTVHVAAADIHGNSSTSAVSELRLEVELVQAVRVMTIGDGVQSVSGYAPASGDLQLVETHSNRLVFAYSGGHGLYTNQLLASSNPNNIFYRCITELDDDAENGQITVYTRDARLEEFFAQGSLNTEAISWTEYIEDTNGVMVQAIQPAWEVPFGIGMEASGAIFPLDFQNDNLKLQGNLGSWAVGAGMDITANFVPSGNLVVIPLPPYILPEIVMDRCDIVLDGNLNVMVAPNLLIEASAEENSSMPLITPIHKFVGGFAGPVPVWVELVFEINLGADVSAEAAASLYGGISIDRAINYHLRLRDAEWAEIGDGDTGWVFTPIPLEVTLEGAMNARVYLQPKISVYVYSLVGAYAALEPYIKYQGQYRLLPDFYYRHELSAGLDFVVGMDIRLWPDEWGMPTPWNFPVLTTPLHFDEGPSGELPTIATVPQNVTVAEGEAVTFSVAANGTAPLSYRWYHNGVDTRRTTASISFTAAAGSAGTYSVVVANEHGQANASATLTVTESGGGAAGNYLVIDLSGGPSASSYPVSYMSAPPSGGWTDEYKTTKLVMRRIPAGTFTMGSPADELGRYSDETQRQVTLTKDYYMGVFEVTQRQWELVMGNKPSYFNNSTYYASRPVERVSYHDIRENADSNSAISPNWPQSSAVGASSFVGKLRAKTGLASLDLPTEAQWERACRAGTGMALNSGKNLTNTGSCPNMSEVGRYWYNGGSGYSQGGDTSVATAKVGSYLPNAWGLYDMHGNAWEWCLDWYETYHAATTDPAGAASGSIRVSRGGGWGYFAYGCRSAIRYGSRPSYRYFSFGFRLSRTLP